MIGEPEWKTKEGYATPPERLDKLNEVFERIEAWTMTKTKYEVMDICNPLDIPVGPILSMKELMEDEGLRETGTIVDVDHPERGRYVTVGCPGDGVPLVRVPEHSGDITLSIDPDGPFSGAVLLRYNGEEENTDGTTLDSWTRVDLSGSYDLNNQVELFTRIENLLDEDYQQILGYGTPDLSGYLGVRLRY